MNSSQAAKYCITVNLDSEQMTLQVCTFFIDKILKRFDKRLPIAMTLIDLQKAFNTIKHEILLKNFPEQ